MSWWVYAKGEPCPHCGRGDDLWLEKNVTYNVSPMFRLALEGVTEDGLWGLNKMPHEQALSALEHAIRYFIEHRERLEGLNPSNGWGSYSSALEDLRAFRRWLEDNPGAVLEVS